MKKIISIIVCLSLLLSTMCVFAYAAETIKFSVDAKPTGSYQKGSDKLNIKGWAFAYSGAAVRCYYQIDNGSETAVTPVNRKDVQNAFPGQCTQLDCGFDEYISTDSIAGGTHTFRFIARTSGTSKVLCETTFAVTEIKSDCNKIPSGSFSVEDISYFNIIGWAFNTDGASTDCFYQIDNGTEVLLPRVTRNDVYNAFPGTCSQTDCGFNYNIPSSEFFIGTHTLRLIARSGNVSKTLASSEVTITSSADYFKYSPDNNITGSYVQGTTEEIFISGWAFSTDGNECRCYYMIDDNSPIPLTPHTRTDVANAFSGICKQTDCGYQMNVTVENLSLGVHKFRVIAKSNKVSQIIRENDFLIISADGELKSHPEFIAEGTYNLDSESYVHLKGWGFNTSAEAVTFYGKFDNGTEFYLASEERTDVFNAFSNCYRTDCGYSTQAYIGNLSSGTHTCTVTMRSGNKSQVVGTSTFTVIRPEYRINFNANGGSGAPASLTKTFGKNLTISDTVPIKDYYTFKEWNTQSDGSGIAVKSGESYKENSSTTLYAIWEHEKIELNDNSALHFDAKKNLVYGEELLTISANDLKNNFKNQNKSVSDAEITTGTEVVFNDSDGIYGTVHAVILGDVNGDGKIDGTDAVIVSCLKDNLLTESNLDNASLSAADCVRDGQISADDILKLVNVGLLNDSVDQNAASSRGYYDTEFSVEGTDCSSDSIFLNGKAVHAEITGSSDRKNITLNADCDEFNYYGIRYSSDTYAKGTITYKLNGSSYSEVFFLEPAQNGEFYSFIDGVFNKERSTELVSVSLTPLNASSFNMNVSGIAVFNREVPETVTYIQNNRIKIGLNMDWGGSLSYYEDLDSDVQAVSDNGIIRIDTNASQRYGTESLNNSVNLINCHDTGRLVQQSYYGTTNYDMGFFNGHYCAYNPVQGGNMYNESSKIVDIRCTENTIYVKCRPLDWAKSKEYITDSYMEATYTLCDDTLKTECRFVDFSGYDPASKGQEIPAFYGAATMDKFVYYNGKNPWTNDSLSTLTKLDEYEYAHYPAVYPTENWGALTGEFEDSFSIGLYIPDSKYILAGVYGSITAQTENPDTSNPTSYLAGGREMVFRSYDPIEYDFYITTGTVDNIRNTFKDIAEANS
ncbi:MAG: InlB B-repeat-containing protein [Clostridia bacterium]|nr:InlB B-repeat-containing protein [Clostridia bacterium]